MTGLEAVALLVGITFTIHFCGDVRETHRMRRHNKYMYEHYNSDGFYNNVKPPRYGVDRQWWEKKTYQEQVEDFEKGSKRK